MQAKEDQLKRLNAISPRTTVEVPLFPSDEKQRSDRMSAIMDDIIHGRSRDPSLVSELVSLGHRCIPHDSSMRLLELKQKIKHYNTLKQEAAKDKLWQKIQGIIYGLESEVNQSRAARERGGKNQ